MPTFSHKKALEEAALKRQNMEAERKRHSTHGPIDTEMEQERYDNTTYDPNDTREEVEKPREKSENHRFQP